ncbi:MAG: hypothetical protein LUE10_00895 [Alistipes sp.]|nr:hypothetical protein [Alistipes sp.]
MKNIFAFAISSLTLGASFSCSDDKDKDEQGYVNPADASSWYYKGTMEVAPVAEGGSVYYWENELMRLVFSEDRKSCNLVMYKANFADDMPVELDIVVNGLSVSQNSSGYTITGNNIIPLYYNHKEGELNPYPR